MEFLLYQFKLNVETENIELSLESLKILINNTKSISLSEIEYLLKLKKILLKKYLNAKLEKTTIIEKYIQEGIKENEEKRKNKLLHHISSVNDKDRSKIKGSEYIVDFRQSSHLSIKSNSSIVDNNTKLINNINQLNSLNKNNNLSLANISKAIKNDRVGIKETSLKYIDLLIIKAKNNLNQFILMINSIIEKTTTLNSKIINKQNAIKRELENDEIENPDDVVFPKTKEEELMSLYLIKASLFKNYVDNTENRRKYVETAFDCYIQAIKFWMNNEYLSLFTMRLFYSYVKFLCMVIKDVYRGVLFTKQCLEVYSRDSEVVKSHSQFSKIKRILVKFDKLKKEYFNEYMETLKQYFPLFKNEIISL